jgi:hypothetical protein
MSVDGISIGVPSFSLSNVGAMSYAPPFSGGMDLFGGGSMQLSADTGFLGAMNFFEGYGRVGAGSSLWSYDQIGDNDAVGGSFAAGSLVGNWSGIRRQTQQADRYFAQYGFPNMGAYHRDNYIQPQQESISDRDYVRQLYSAGRGRLVHPKTGEQATTKTAFKYDKAIHNGLIEKGKQNPDLGKAMQLYAGLVEVGTKQLEPEHAKASAWRAMLARATVNKGRTFKATSDNKYPQLAAVLANVMSFGTGKTTAEAVSGSTAGTALQGQSPEDLAKTLVAGWGEKRAMFMAKQLQTHIGKDILRTGLTMPDDIGEAAASLLATKGLTTDQIAPVVKRMEGLINDGKITAAHALLMIDQAEAVEETDADGNPKPMLTEDRNRMAFDLLLALHGVEQDRSDRKSLYQRLVRAVPLKKGKDQWHDFGHVMSEFDAMWKLVGTGTKATQDFAKRETQKLERKI